MSRDEPGHAAGQAAGLLASLRNLIATLVVIVQTRLELLGNELQEERLRLAQLAVLGLAALFFLGLGILLATLFVVVLFWDSNRLLVVGIFAALYIAIGIAAALALRRKAAEKTHLFEASLGELAKDRRRLQSE